MVILLPGTVNFGSHEEPPTTSLVGFRTTCARCSQVTFDLDASESDADRFRLDINFEVEEGLTDLDCVSAADSSLGGGFL